MVRARKSQRRSYQIPWPSRSLLTPSLHTLAHLTLAPPLQIPARIPRKMPRRITQAPSRTTPPLSGGTVCANNCLASSRKNNCVEHFDDTHAEQIAETAPLGGSRWGLFAPSSVAVSIKFVDVISDDSYRT